MSLSNDVEIKDSTEVEDIIVKDNVIKGVITKDKENTI